MLFDRICRKNGIEHLLTKFRSPTTTGKIERWHQTLQRECLEPHGPFASLAQAQQVITEFRTEYNTRRPHQALEMATPASRFRPIPAQERDVLGLWLPADLAPALTIREPNAASTSGVVVEAERTGYEGPGRGQGRSSVGRSTLTPPAGPRGGLAAAATTEAVEVDREVPVCGNLTVGPQQFWLGPAQAGQSVRLWIDTTTVHVSMAGVRIKTLPSRFSTADLTRLRATGGARPAGPAPAPPSPAALAAGAVVELDRTVTGVGLVALGGHSLHVGIPLAGQRVTLRLEEHLVHVITDGRLWRTMASPLDPAVRGRLRGARLAGPPPVIAPDPVRVQRRVSCRGGIQICRQRVHVGLPHAGKIVTIEVEDERFRILDEHDTMLCVVPRTTTEEVTRLRAFGHRAAQA